MGTSDKSIIAGDFSKRETGIDILKIVACFSVIALHYTVNHYESTDNFGFFILLHMFRWFVFGCIGFFILATGYLNCYKKLEKNTV